MLRKVISIGLLINIVLCSIGVQVMQHHCIWCGGDKIEVIVDRGNCEAEHSCCAPVKTRAHQCDENGCCQPKLLKLNNIVSSEDGFELKRVETKPISMEVVYLMTYPEETVYNSIKDRFENQCCFGFFSPPVAFLVPLKC
jgi:hypothetical protein